METKFDLEEFKKKHGLKLKAEVDDLIKKKEQALYNYTTNKNNRSSLFNQLIEHREKLSIDEIQ